MSKIKMLLDVVQDMRRLTDSLEKMCIRDSLWSTALLCGWV